MISTRKWPWTGNRTGKDAEAVQRPLVDISHLIFSWCLGCIPVVMIFLRSNIIASLIFIPWVCRGRNFYPFSCFIVFVERPYLMRSVTKTILAVLLWTCSLLLRTIIFLLTFLLCFILVVTWNARDPGFVAESWTLEITWRKVSISDGTLKRESPGQEAEIRSSHPHIPGCCGGWGANCANTGASKSWQGFSAWEEKKKARGDREDLDRKREEGFLVMDSD